MQIQADMSERALELLALPDEPCYLLDLGCGWGWISPRPCLTLLGRGSWRVTWLVVILEKVFPSELELLTELSASVPCSGCVMLTRVTTNLTKDFISSSPHCTPALAEAAGQSSSSTLRTRTRWR